MIDVDGLFGHVNDSIRGLATDGPTNETWGFICECPDLDCHTLVSLTLVEFDARRSASPPSPILSSTHATDSDTHKERTTSEIERRTAHLAKRAS